MNVRSISGILVGVAAGWIAGGWLQKGDPAVVGGDSKRESHSLLVERSASERLLLPGEMSQ
jgi:hypothetical protein